MYRGAHEVQKRVLGSEHPSTLAAAMSLASALGAKGQYAAAATMHREALEAQKRVLGPEHPDTLRAANNLANALRS